MLFVMASVTIAFITEPEKEDLKKIGALDAIIKPFTKQSF
jgi:hypothetical protein